jgi:hypothetical protein
MDAHKQNRASNWCSLLRRFFLITIIPIHKLPIVAISGGIEKMCIGINRTYAGIMRTTLEYCKLVIIAYIIDEFPLKSNNRLSRP